MVQDLFNRAFVEAQAATSITLRKDEGQGMVEYGLIIALVAIIAAAGFTILGNYLNTFIGGLKDSF